MKGEGSVLGSMERRTMSRCLSALATVIGIGVFAAPQTEPSALESPREGDAVDVAPWGERTAWEQGRAPGLWWEDPRDIACVRVTFAVPPAPEVAPRLQWWHAHWPEHRIPRDRPAGAGESGWLHLGDVYQGEWRDADARLDKAGPVWTYTFRPVNAKEFPGIEGFAAPYRNTLRLRLLFPGPAPGVERFEAFTDSVWKRLPCEVLWDTNALAGSVCEARMEAFNGWVRHPALRIGLEAVAPGWALSEGQKQAVTGLQAEVWVARSPNVNTFDRTVVTVRGDGRAFSFAPEELLAGRSIFAPGSGALVQAGWSTGMTTYAEAATRWRAGTDKTLHARVLAEPEQSLERALAEQPAKGRFYMPLGTEGGRQRFGVDPDGSVFCVNDRIDQPVGRDTPRRTWGGNRLDYDFDLPRSEPVRRWLEGDCLPIIHAEWEHEGIRYSQTAFATRLEPGGLGFPDMQADDTTVLMVRIAGRNLASEYQPAQVRLGLKVDGRPVALVARDGRLYARQGDQERFRMLAEGQGQAIPPEVDGKIAFFGNMPPGTDGALIVKIPFTTLDRPEELDRLSELDFNDELARVRRFWQARVDAGTQVATPVPDINRFYRAHLTHLLINCGREVGADRLAARVGGFSYGVFGNES